MGWSSLWRIANSLLTVASEKAQRAYSILITFQLSDVITLDVYLFSNSTNHTNVNHDYYIIYIKI